MEQSKNLARWQKITLTDVMCVHYWINLGFTLYLIFHWNDAVSDLLSNQSRKLAALIAVWAISICFYQTILGTTGLLKSIWTFILSPFSVIRAKWGFVRDTRATLKKMKANFPYRILFLTSLPMTILLGFTESSYLLMMLFFYLIPLQVFFLMRFTWLWTLNPIKFLDRFKELGAHASVVKMIDTLAAFDKKAVDAKAVVEKLGLFKKIINAVEALVATITNPILSLRFFIGLMSFVGTYIILASAIFLKILNVAIFENSLEFDASLFQDRDIWKYVYVAANSFISADLHGVTIKSPLILYVLTFLPFAALFLLGVVILAYSTVTQSNVNDRFTSITKGVVDIITKATEKATSNMAPDIIVQSTDLDQKADTQPANETPVH